MYFTGRFSVLFEINFRNMGNFIDRFAGIKAILTFLESILFALCFWNTVKLDLLIFYLGILHLYIF